MNDEPIECPNCGSTELTVVSVSHRETLEEFTNYRCAACNHTFENITDLEGEEREEMRNYAEMQRFERGE
ncbi:hypothetical protein QUA03_21775 [Microcoleus sp. S36b_A4]|uniref:hypothetical protein n=1 Tax=Microcoleus sp. S36b_A4 TaxID=3055420 RepID=UPI002FCE7502